MSTRILAVAVLALGMSQGTAAEISWAKDWAAAQSSAKTQKKPMMVDFYTDWCGWCKKLDKDTYTDAKVVQLSGQFVALKVNAEKEGKDLAKKYVIGGFPTILFLDPAGDVIGKIGGYLPPPAFAAEMTKVQTAFLDFPKVEAALKAKPEDGEANGKMAGMLAARGKLKEAHEHLTRAEKGGLKLDVLAPIYNAVADVYQMKEKLDEAIGLFRKADMAEAKAADRSYAKISIVQCYLGKQDQEAAAKEAKALIDLKDAVPEHVRAAKNLLKQLEG